MIYLSIRFLSGEEECLLGTAFYRSLSKYLHLQIERPYEQFNVLQLTADFFIKRYDSQTSIHRVNYEELF